MFNPPTTNAILGSYNLELVALSFFVAVLASFTALNLFKAAKFEKRGIAKILWHFAAAFAMGGGIWSMHFIAMLAFQLPLAVNYDVWTTCFSFVVAVLASGTAFYISSLQLAFNRLIGGVVMGIGIATMHYTGMAAMEMNAEIYYDAPLFILSILIAIGASSVALWFTTIFSEKLFKRQPVLKVIGAVIMGVAVVGMHFTGVAGTIFIPHEKALLMAHATLSPTFLAFFIATITLLILGMGIIASIINQRFSERDEAEKKLKVAKDQAETANAAKSELIARMHHELRTPLNAIIGFSQLMLNSNEHFSPDKKENLAAINQAGCHLLELVNDVLKLSVLESREIQINIERVDVIPMLKELFTIVQKQAQPKNIRLIDEISEHYQNLFVQADRIRLKQVLINLLSNAVKYNRQDGHITLSCVTKIEDNRIELSVADSGIGIAEDQLFKIFEPFERLGQEYLEMEGTGVGLTICKKLMTMMHGTINCTSTKNEGSRFTIELPVE